MIRIAKKKIHALRNSTPTARYAYNGRSGMNCMVFYALYRHSTAHNGTHSNVLIPQLTHMYYNEKLKWIVRMCACGFNTRAHARA